MQARALVKWDEKLCNSKLTQTPWVFMKKWECIKLVSGLGKWTVSRVFCRLWKSVCEYHKSKEMLWFVSITFTISYLEAMMV